MLQEERDCGITPNHDDCGGQLPLAQVDKLTIVKPDIPNV